jgi:hypothetical protein
VIVGAKTVIRGSVLIVMFPSPSYNTIRRNTPADVITINSDSANKIIW